MGPPQTRYKCLVPNCPHTNDFSLLTLYEHLAYHLKDRGFTEHFEYRCLSCNAYFTNKIFMVLHKLDIGKEEHLIEKMPEINLTSPQNNEKLKKAVSLLSYDFLRHKFAISNNGQSTGRPGLSGTPTGSKYTTEDYTPTTPRNVMAFSTPNRTPRYDEEIRSQDFSNCFANATPKRLDRPPMTPVDNMSTWGFDEMSSRRQELNRSFNRPMVREDMGNADDIPNRFESRERECKQRFDTGSRGRGNFRGGPRDSSGYGGRDNSRDRGESGEFRGRNNFRNNDGEVGGGYRGHPGFRGGEDRRGGGFGRGRGRGRGGFNNDFRDGDGIRRNRSRSRSRSPLKKTQDRRSYSRSRSGSPINPGKEEDSKSQIKIIRERSYSASPKSD